MKPFIKIWTDYLDLAKSIISEYSEQFQDESIQQEKMERILKSKYFTLVELARHDVEKECETHQCDWPEEEWKSFENDLLTALSKVQFTYPKKH